MPQSDQQNTPFIEVFRDSLGRNQALSWQEFTTLALYHPDVGYYKADNKRVGHGPTTDFYTSSSLGRVFARLVVGALNSLLNGRPLQQHALVEIGAEPESDLFASFKNRFASIHTIRLGELLELPSPAIVFANELFDAQPFHRLRFDQAHGWQTCGVALKDDQLIEIPLEAPPDEIRPLLQDLPPTAEHGYRLDISLSAEELLQSILANNSVKAFLFFDYGATWAELIANLPQGSARAYSRHRQSNDLLKNPGQQDLTCHVCWDRLAAIAAAAGFRQPQCQRQESFFMHHATADIATIIGSANGHLERERRTLQEILHPSYFGHRFQAFYGTR